MTRGRLAERSADHRSPRPRPVPGCPGSATRRGHAGTPARARWAAGRRRRARRPPRRSRPTSAPPGRPCPGGRSRCRRPAGSAAPRHRHGQSGLAGTPRPGQRDQAGARVYRRRQLRDLPGATDQLGRVARQARQGAQAAQRRVLVDSPSATMSYRCSGSGRSFSRCSPGRSVPYPARRGPQHGPGRLRHHDLPAAAVAAIRAARCTSRPM